MGAYEDLEEAWQNGELTHAEALEVARELGYDDE